jgi:hypothetical protein
VSAAYRSAGEGEIDADMRWAITRRRIASARRKRKRKETRASGADHQRIVSPIADWQSADEREPALIAACCCPPEPCYPRDVPAALDRAADSLSGYMVSTACCRVATGARAARERAPSVGTAAASW